MHQDVIMGCIDDPDISIRLQALDLGASMVSSDNLVTVVERLMQQLRNAPPSTRSADDGRSHALGIEPAADSDGEDPEETLKPTAGHQINSPALPAEYKITVLRQILQMCSKDTYTNVLDFEWYIDTLVQLIRLVPAGRQGSESQGTDGRNLLQEADVSCAIGWELRNVAVRVSTVRSEAVRAATSLLATSKDESPTLGNPGGQGVLTFAAWVVGEYFDSSALSYSAMDSLIHPKAHSLPASAICAYLQAIPKILVATVSQEPLDWSSERKTMVSLLVRRIIHFLEPLTTHPDLEVQERSVEFLELMRVTSQAVTSHSVETTEGTLLFTRAIPQLFMGFELNPVAPAAQSKVPLPEDLDLDTVINKDLTGLLQRANHDFSLDIEAAEFESFYKHRSMQKAISGPALDKLQAFGSVSEPSSYQQNEYNLSDADVLLRRRNERQERNKDDPFYICNDDISSGTSTPFHNILRSTNGEDVDVDSIPIMNLDLGNQGLLADSSDMDMKKQKRKRPKKVHIAKDENIEQEIAGVDQAPADDTGAHSRIRDKARKSLLQVDSSGLSSISLDSNETTARQLNIERQEAQESEMARALAEVERLRLEMQRASERIEATDGTPAEGVLVKKKKKKPKHLVQESVAAGDPGLHRKPHRQSKGAEDAPVVKKRRKKRKPVITSPHNTKVSHSD